MRREVSTLWGGEEWLYFSISALFSFLLYHVLLFAARWLRKRVTRKVQIAIPVLISLFYTFIFLGSYGYYLNNGILPNYYTIQYLIDNPYNSYTLLSDSLRWYFAPIFVVVLYAFYYFITWGISVTGGNHLHYDRINTAGDGIAAKNKADSGKWKWLKFRFIVRFVVGGLFIFLILFFNNNIRFYDQCAVADANIVSISARTVTNRIGGVDKGNVGLSSRIPSAINSKYPMPGFNVLFIVCESLRPQNMSVYGYKRQTTPSLDAIQNRVGQELFAFPHAFTNASTTVVSLPSIFSGIGQYQSPSLLYRMPLYWDYAKACGYSTFLISAHDNDWYHLSIFFTGAADYYWNKKVSGKPRYNDLGVDDLYAVEEFKRIAAPMIDSGKYFAGALHFNTNHMPYTTRPDFKRWTGDSQDEYDNSILLQDYYFGQVFDFLASKNALENTIIVITSDHGQAFREHNYIGHLECNYIETISVPLIYYIPTNLQSHFDMDQLRRNLNTNRQLIDVMPSFITIFNLDGKDELTEFTKNYDGTSVFRPTNEDRDIIICNSHEISESNVGLSLIRGAYHYLFRTNITPIQEELYQFRTDTWEKQNIWNELSDGEKDSYRNVFTNYEATKSIINLRKKN